MQSTIPGIQQLPISHNHGGARPMPISGIVVHLTAGHGSPRGWFERPASRASATYCIMQSGLIEQYLDEGVIAWHAGIKAEYLDPKYIGPHKPTWTGIKPFTNPNAYLLGIENEGTVDDVWSAPQLDALTSLMADIAHRYKFPIDRMHVAGHHEIWDMHSCPGPKCPMDQIMASAAEKLAVMTEAVPLT